MICNNCKKEVAQSIYCTNCGSLLKKDNKNNNKKITIIAIVSFVLSIIFYFLSFLSAEYSFLFLTIGLASLLLASIFGGINAIKNKNIVSGVIFGLSVVGLVLTIGFALVFMIFAFFIRLFTMVG